MEKELVNIGLGIFMGDESGEGLTKELPENAKVSPCPNCGEEPADKGTFRIFAKRLTPQKKRHVILWGNCGKCRYDGPYCHFE